MNVVYSSTEENYLKAIYHLQQLHERVSTTQLADHMRIRPATATDMLQKLEQKKLLHYKKYYGFTLTAAGLRLAVHVIRKHRLWEYFLVTQLGFPWEEVHAIAEELEHVSSDLLVEKLDQFLGFPTVDPHGDPIPDGKGKFKLQKQENLLQLPTRKLLEVCSVTNQSQDMLELLNHYQIQIGSKLKIMKRFDFDGSVQVRIDKLPMITISEQVAKNIYCKQ
ncbi:MAG TPA: metal-dependent transcriptional regulator [Ferruginibacter sp.]|nr:metal-dependent transcriptional regulator [Ferruginibacter sp.]